jgi:hypothetical protein
MPNKKILKKSNDKGTYLHLASLIVKLAVLSDVVLRSDIVSKLAKLLTLEYLEKNLFSIFFFIFSTKSISACIFNRV